MQRGLTDVELKESDEGVRRLILGSTSPYRKALLERLKIPFTTAAPHIDESPEENEKPEVLVRRLAVAKAREIARTEKEALIIAGDQVAVCGDTILGKPGSRDRAIKQLQHISGQTIVFETAVCLLDAKTDFYQLERVPFTVYFRVLNIRQIENYLDREDVLNCAGSFKSEGLGITLCERFSGDDPTALIGLPLIRLTGMLERWKEMTGMTVEEF